MATERSADSCGGGGGEKLSHSAEPQACPLTLRLCLIRSSSFSVCDMVWFRDGEDPARYKYPENEYGDGTGETPGGLDWNEFTEMRLVRNGDLGGHKKDMRYWLIH